MNQATDRRFSFGEFEVDSAKRLLLKRGHSVHLKSKAFDLLLTLIDHKGEVLSKNQLLDLVWENQFVEENNLTVHVAALRKALGETKNEHRFIVTVPGHGYRFVGELLQPDTNGNLIEGQKENELDGENGSGGGPYKRLTSAGDVKTHLLLVDEHALLRKKVPVQSNASNGSLSLFKSRNLWLAAAVFVLLAAGLVYFAYFAKSHNAINSLAVLPLVNVGADPKLEYLSDGITENLINDLSQSPNLKVIARNSVFRYKVTDAQNSQADINKIAGELGVQAVLTGRVQQLGDDLVISVDLVDVQNNKQIWGEHYNRKLADVFAVQEEIARNISGKLRVKLNGVEQSVAGKRYTDNIRAFESYMMGRAHIHRRTREDLLIAAGYYEQAIKEDQNYALAYSGLAEVYGNLGVRGYISPVEGHRRLDESARKAIQLDENLAEAHVMMGYSLTGFAPYNFHDGDREIKRAIELSPSLAIAHLYLSLSLLRQGQLDEGLVEMLRARELDPYSAIIARQVALYYTLKRDNVRALELLKQADEMGPSFTATTEIDVYIQNQLYDEALSKLEKEKQQRHNDPLLIYATGMVYAAQGKRNEAGLAINEIKHLSGTDIEHAQWLAKIYAMLGDREEALTLLQRGLDNGTIGAFYKDEPVWDTLRNNSRFDDLARQIGIPQ